MNAAPSGLPVLAAIRTSPVRGAGCTWILGIRRPANLGRGSPCRGICVLNVQYAGRQCPPMDARFDLNGIAFVWDTAKALRNQHKRGVSFEQAAKAFFILSCASSMSIETRSCAMR